MKNKHLVHHHQSARIYKHYYRPSFNFFKLLLSVLAVFISGSSHAAKAYHHRK